MREWARHANDSPLYVHLADVIAGSSELLRVMSRMVHLPRPNVLFGGVHYLLMNGRGPDLARFYPSLTAQPEPLDGVAVPFTEFVMGHEEELVEIGRTRLTQTNECRRCAILLPGVWLTGLSRFHLVDIGASAGLNLAIDRFRYRWGDVEWGPPDSPVTLECEMRGMPPQPRPIEVLSRVGLDLNPVDVGDPDERAWLDALVWPEHAERRRRLRKALSMVSSMDIEMVRGSAVDTLGPVLDGLPNGDPVVVMDSFVMNQLTVAERGRIGEILEMARGKRAVARVSLWHMVRDAVWSKLAIDRGEGIEIVGEGHPHGEWLDLSTPRRTPGSGPR